MKLCLISQTNCHCTTSESDAPDKVVRHSQIHQLHYEFNISGVRFCCTTLVKLRLLCFRRYEVKYEVAVISFEQAVSINQLDYCALVHLTEVAILTDRYPRWGDW